MTEFSLTKGSVLIIPGYTDAENLQNYYNQKNNNKKTSSSEDLGSSYIDKTTGNTTNSIVSKDDVTKNKYKKVEPPHAMYFNVRNVEFTPHGKDYEEFDSAQGMILVEKACDRFAEVQLEVLVHQRLSSVTGKLSYENNNQDVDIHVEDFHYNTDEEYSFLWVYPEDYDDKFVELRKSFFDNLQGRPLTVISPLFPTIVVGYMTECDYSIGEGEEESAWSITIREVNNWGF